MVSWVRCGTRLYRFLIFATFLTLQHRQTRIVNMWACYFKMLIWHFNLKFVIKGAPSDTLYDRFKRGNKMCLPVDLEQLVLSMAIFCNKCSGTTLKIQILLEFEKNSLWFPTIWLFTISLYTLNCHKCSIQTLLEFEKNIILCGFQRYGYLYVKLFQWRLAGGPIMAPGDCVIFWGGKGSRPPVSPLDPRMLFTIGLWLLFFLDALTCLFIINCW